MRFHAKRGGPTPPQQFLWGGVDGFLEGVRNPSPSRLGGLDRRDQVQKASFYLGVEFDLIWPPSSKIRTGPSALVPVVGQQVHFFAG